MQELVAPDISAPNSLPPLLSDSPPRVPTPVSLEEIEDTGSVLWFGTLNDSTPFLVETASLFSASDVSDVSEVSSIVSGASDPEDDH